MIETDRIQPPGRPIRPSADPFRPAFWLRGPHLQTIAAAWLPARGPAGPGRRWIVNVSDRSAVAVDLHSPGGSPRGTILSIHGMGGSSASPHVQRVARLAVERGWAAACMNLRNCGGTETLSSTFYNAGQSDDLAAVLVSLATRGLPRPFVVVGFSLGGNIAMRYAGLAGEQSEADGFVAVNPPIDLRTCVLALERSGNRLYQWHYVRVLCRQVRRIERLRASDRPVLRPRGVRSVREFDRQFTAPDGGWKSVDHYYADAAAARSLSGVRRPCLVLSARDDPFVPVAIFEPFRSLPWIDFLHPDAGGHCGYWQSERPSFWAAQVALTFAERVADA